MQQCVVCENRTDTVPIVQGDEVQYVPEGPIHRWCLEEYHAQGVESEEGDTPSS